MATTGVVIKFCVVWTSDLSQGIFNSAPYRLWEVFVISYKAGLYDLLNMLVHKKGGIL